MFPFFAKKYSDSERQLFDFLRRNLLFKKLTDKELFYFLPSLHLRTYKADEVIFFRNDPSQAIYLIQQGEVKLTVDVQGKFEDLVKLSVHESFGDDSMLENSQRNYHAICTADNTEIFVIPQINILDIFHVNTEIKAKMLQALTQHHSKYIAAVFKVYRESLGFFELRQTYHIAHL
ncbi:MAG: cyclic nucleotide-binding domain-containing protein [Bacteroidetes bacterium]|nr:MAG: cyclic nucleotide-binding domain-containing protein [Bacteroidota bacterium]